MGRVMMKQEDKDLLLKDLCARLPYRVKIALKNNEAYHHENIAKIGDTTVDELKGFDGKYFRISHDNPLDWDWYINEISIEDIKPYLFHLSSMTEEQAKEIATLHGLKNILSVNIGDEYIDVIIDDGFSSTEKITLWYDELISSIKCFDWLNANHFDYRGLIEKGIAIEAPEGMYKLNFTKR